MLNTSVGATVCAALLFCIHCKSCCFFLPSTLCQLIVLHEGRPGISPVNCSHIDQNVNSRKKVVARVFNAVFCCDQCLVSHLIRAAIIVRIDRDVWTNKKLSNTACRVREYCNSNCLRCLIIRSSKFRAPPSIERTL